MEELFVLPNHHYWVARVGEKIIGTVGVIALQNSYATLKSMFLDKAFRHKEQHITMQLLQVATGKAIELNCENMYLGTMTQFKAAQRFYEKNGFDKISGSELPANFPANSVDDVFYVKRIIPPDGRIIEFLEFEAGRISYLGYEQTFAKGRFLIHSSGSGSK